MPSAPCVRCINPRTLPAKGVREEHQRVHMASFDRYIDEARQSVRCMECHPCQMAKLGENSSRLIEEAKHHDHVGLVTLTFADEHLPMTEPTGEDNPAQAKLRKQLMKKFDNGSANDIDCELVDVLDRQLVERKPYPTLVAKHIQDWRKSCHRLLGFAPMMVRNGEYGSKGDRPHYHACLYGQPPELGWALANLWKFGRVDYLPGRVGDDDALIRYAAKDLAKGSAWKKRYIARGQLPPQLWWPRKPYVAAHQEMQIATTLIAYAERHGVAELLRQHYSNGFGKVFRNDGKVQRYGRTAVENGMKRVHAEFELTKWGAVEAAKMDAEVERWRNFEALNPESPWFDRELCEADARSVEQARRQSERVKRNHERKLRKKGIKTR